jgi:glycosyltransferase involved in cell wall biosynthesis
MSLQKRIIWLCPEFTPAHEVLLRALAVDPEISLRVEVMSGPSSTHPFEPLPDRPYEWGQADPDVRVDNKLVTRTLSEPNAWVMVCSYLRPTLMAAMEALAWANRKFIYLTDTPLPQVVEWHTDRPRRRSWLRRLARRRRLRWIFSEAHRVLATGQPGVDAVVSLGCPRQKAVVFPFWVDLTTLRKGIATIPANKILLSVGQLVHRKGCDIAIEALGKALGQGALDGVELHFLGDGPDRQNLERLAEARGVGRRVVFHGWLQPPQVAEVLAKASGVIHPARWDPFPVAVLEAMAAGLPVLGSDASGSVVDRVENGVSGFIHRTGDAGQLAEHLTMLFADRDTPVRMGAAARRRAEEWPPERGVQIIKDIIMNE